MPVIIYMRPMPPGPVTCVALLAYPPGPASRPGLGACSYAGPWPGLTVAAWLLARCRGECGVHLRRPDDLAASQILHAASHPPCLLQLPRTLLGFVHAGTFRILQFTDLHYNGDNASNLLHATLALLVTCTSLHACTLHAAARCSLHVCTACNSPDAGACVRTTRAKRACCFRRRPTQMCGGCIYKRWVACSPLSPAPAGSHIQSATLCISPHAQFQAKMIDLS